MGYASRANPIAFDPQKDARDVMTERMRTFVNHFEDRAHFDAFLEANTDTLSDSERAFLESLWAEKTAEVVL